MFCRKVMLSLSKVRGKIRQYVPLKHQPVHPLMQHQIPEE
jgi:hypothetical protein